MFLKGKVALISGATSGIGLAYAKALAAEGAAVTINGFGDPDEIAATCASLAAASGAAALHDGADMSDGAAVTQMVARCTAALGAPDIVIANAGIQNVQPIEDFDPAKWERIIAINLSSAFYLTRAAVPAMKAKRWGRLIYTASAHATTASPYKSAYVSAKHGVLGLARTAALELATHGITANCISPGYVWTPLVEKQIPDTMKARGLTERQVIDEVLLVAQPTKQFVTVEQVAAMALFLCRDEAASITGANMAMDGGWTAA